MAEHLGSMRDMSYIKIDLILVFILVHRFKTKMSTYVWTDNTTFQDFRCSMTYDEFIVWTQGNGWMGFLEGLSVTKIVTLPVLWTICCIGILSNIIVIFPDLFLAFSSTSIFVSSISFALIIRSVAFLFLWDVRQGKFSPE